MLKQTCVFRVNFFNEAYIFLRLDLPQLQLESLNCQKSEIRTNSPCCSVLLWISFCFLQVNQQKGAGMVSTNNATYSEQIYKPYLVETIPHCVFDWEEWVGRHPMLNSYFIKLKKQPLEVFYINAVLKIFAIFTRKNWVKLLRTLKNICIRLLLNRLYEVIVWKFVPGLHLKPSWLSNITKITIAFKPKLSTKFGAYAIYIFNSYAFLWT